MNRELGVRIMQYVQRDRARRKEQGVELVAKPWGQVDDPDLLEKEGVEKGRKVMRIIESERRARANQEMERGKSDDGDR